MGVCGERQGAYGARKIREFWRSIMSIVCTKWIPGELLSAKDTHLRGYDGMGYRFG